MTYEKCSYKVKRIFYEKGDYVNIRQHLNNIDWKELMSGKDVQQKYDVFTEIVKLCEEKYIPSKIVISNLLNGYQTILGLLLERNIIYVLYCIVLYCIVLYYEALY